MEFEVLKNQRTFKNTVIGRVTRSLGGYMPVIGWCQQVLGDILAARTALLVLSF